MEIVCDECGKFYFKEVGRINEAQKRGWKSYCSPECQNQAKNLQVKFMCSYQKCSKLFMIKQDQLKKIQTTLLLAKMCWICECKKFTGKNMAKKNLCDL